MRGEQSRRWGGGEGGEVGTGIVVHFLNACMEKIQVQW